MGLSRVAQEELSKSRDIRDVKVESIDDKLDKIISLLEKIEYNTRSPKSNVPKRYVSKDKL